MLQYMGSRQPPRKYNVSHEARPCPKNECGICKSIVWTPELLSKLHIINPGQQKMSHMYEMTSEELRVSVLGGCDFCHSLANGIHGKVFLDELYGRFNLIQHDSKDSPMAIVEGPSVEDVQDDQDAAFEDWNDASAFDEDEIEDDVTGGWDAWDDRDTLQEPCKFTVHLSFEKGDDDLLAFLNVYLEAMDGAEMAAPVLGKLKGDDLVELRYHINSQPTPIMTASPFPASVMGTTLGSEPNMQMISAWVGSILRADKDLEVDKEQLPARLIEVQNDTGLRIVNTIDLPQHESTFAALSYVWGTNQTFILTSTTINMLMQGFQLEQLPQTIQDAVTVTRQAWLSYIWVDALCILQDSPTDKARELPKMRHIYKHATITIVAAIAQSANTGFLHHISTPTYFIDPIPITLSDASDIILSYPSSYKRASDPISSRAWTFQELILSTRAVSFSYRGVSLLDRTNPPSADGLISGRDSQLPNLPWNGGMFSLAQTEENIRSTWLTLRAEYSRRNLTYQGDKLLAIAGLAEEISKSYKSTYIAGLWVRDLALDLQWQCLRTDNSVRKARSDIFVAPSWSWASVDAVLDGVEYYGEEEGRDGGEGVKSAMGFEVVSCEVERADEDFEFGAVKSGVLVIRGKAVLLKWKLYEELGPDMEDADGELVRPANDGRKDLVVGVANLDALDDEMVDGMQVTCLATRLIEHIPGRDEVEGMMLLAIDDKRWRRVGFFKLHGQGQFAGCEPREFVIA